MTGIMYWACYAFCNESFIEFGGLSGIQVCQDDYTLKATIISGTQTNAQSIAAINHKSGVHILMQLMRDYGNNGMQDSKEYAFTVLQKLQEAYNPHKASDHCCLQSQELWSYPNAVDVWLQQ